MYRQAMEVNHVKQDAKAEKGRNRVQEGGETGGGNGATINRKAPE
jgi:hypothetical protein